jgi:hypothetical protein
MALVSERWTDVSHDFLFKPASGGNQRHALTKEKTFIVISSR